MIFIKNKSIISIYAISHFIIDLSCAAFIYKFLVPQSGNTMNTAIFILLYDFLAFVLQLPFGILCNNRNKNSYVSLIGCILILFAYIIYRIPIIPIFLIGIGNALFHVGGGIDILNISHKKATKIGIYVAPGALGLFLGCNINKLNYSIFLVISLLILSIILLFMISKKHKTKIKQENSSIFDYPEKKRIVIYIMLFTICIRGYIGFILNYSWKSSFGLPALIAIIMVVLGKVLGGIIADKYGLEKTGLLSLILSAVLFIFSFDNMIIALSSILLFNMTMPITLILLSNYINNYGKAFGLNTLALFLGSLPYFAKISIFNRIGLPLVVLINALMFLVFCKGMNKK